MSVIFSNTTPFIALSAIGQLELLPKLFDRVHVVPHVVRECAAGGAVRVPALTTLAWVNIVAVDETIDPMPLLAPLDIGEKWTLHAAKLASANVTLPTEITRVIIDERIARNVAERLGLAVTGTLGVLLKAKERGLIPSFSAAARAMREEGIFYNEALIARLAKSIGE